MDDNARFLEVARDLLDAQGIALIGVASASAEALKLAAELRPDVTLVDINLGGESGFELARLLAGNGQRTLSRVILISTRESTDYGVLIEDSPAAGFLSKSELSAEGIYRILSPNGSSG